MSAFLEKLDGPLFGRQPLGRPVDCVVAREAGIGHTPACALGGSNADGIAPLMAELREWAGTPRGTVLVYGNRLVLNHGQEDACCLISVF